MPTISFAAIDGSVPYSIAQNSNILRNGTIILIKAETP